MRRFLIFAILLIASSFAGAQCVSSEADPCVLINQSVLDRTAKALDELKSAREVIAAFTKERAATEAERTAYKNLVIVTDSAIGVLQKGIADRETLIALQQKTIELYANLVEKMAAKINAPKSAWSKFLSAAKTVLTLAAGISLGRGGL